MLCTLEDLTESKGSSQALKNIVVEQGHRSFIRQKVTYCNTVENTPLQLEILRSVS